MKTFLTVLAYTFQENIRKKVFIISTIITLILSIGLVSSPAIYNAITKSSNGEPASGGNTQKQIVYVVDDNNFMKKDSFTISKMVPGYDFVFTDKNQTENIKKKIKDTSDSISLAVLEDNYGVPKLKYWVKKSQVGISASDLANVMKKIYNANLLSDIRADKVTTGKILADIVSDEKELGKGFAGGVILSYIVALLLFFSIYMYGYGVATSVASEKTSRVMEILITSAKPSRIILGKSAAMGLIGLLQMILVIGSGVITYKVSFPENFTLGGLSLDLSNFTPYSVGLLFVYFVLGYSLYSMMNAVAGATVSKAEDVQSAIMPVNMVSLIAFYVAYFSMMSPDSVVANVASLIPFTAPFSLPCRILATDVPLWQIGVSTGGLIITIFIVGYISIRLYSGAVLHYGKKLKLNELFGMSK